MNFTKIICRKISVHFHLCKSVNLLWCVYICVIATQSYIDLKFKNNELCF